jgi:tetratricopeptide (TPR) repeat protein
MQRGDDLQISAELVDARDDSHIWGDQYSRKSSDIFALQGELAKEMTTALRMHLSGDDEKRMAKSYTVNPEAYQDYLKGRYWLSKSNEDGVNRGIGYFEQAIEKDPTYALAYSGLADCYRARGGLFLVPPKETYPKAKEAALKALEIDDTLGEAHASLGSIKSSYDWDWSGAEKEFKGAIELNPSDAAAHRAHGVSLVRTGRLEEAIREEKRGLELDPLSLNANRSLGAAFYFAQQYERAIEQERNTLELDTNFRLARDDLGLAYIQKHLYKEGVTEMEDAVALSPGDPPTLVDLGYAYAVAGRRAEAQKVLD